MRRTETQVGACVGVWVQQDCSPYFHPAHLLTGYLVNKPLSLACASEDNAETERLSKK